MNIIYNFFAKTYLAKERGKQFVKNHSAIFLGIALVLMGSTAHAASISDILTNGEELIVDLVSFIINLAVIMGIGAIMYGLKLIYDKSNDRENVKNGQIIFSLAGGAFLVVLWFIVQALAETTGGTVGEEASW